MIAVKEVQKHISTVTSEQIGKCHKVFDGNNQPFYAVESEHDSLVEYHVRWSKQHGFTCSCPAGQMAFAHCRLGVCKHVIWSVAAAAEERQALAEHEALSVTTAQAKQEAVASRMATWSANERREWVGLNNGRMRSSQALVELRKMSEAILGK